MSAARYENRTMTFPTTLRGRRHMTGQQAPCNLAELGGTSVLGVQTNAEQMGLTVALSGVPPNLTRTSNGNDTSKR